MASLSATHKARLERLIVVLEEVETRKKPFNLRSWIEGPDPEDTPREACGTTACALGYAALDPVLRDEGLRMVTDVLSDDGVRETIDVPDIATFNELIRTAENPLDVEVQPFFQNLTGFEAGVRFFGIVGAASEYLFGPWTYDPGRRRPLDVVARVREVMALGGEAPPVKVLLRD